MSAEPVKSNNRIDTPDYTYAVGRVRVLEKALIPLQTWTAMLQADSDDAQNLLLATGYGAACPSRGVEDIVAWELDRAVTTVLEITRDRDLIELFLLQEDAHNLNVLIKCARTGRDPAPLLSRGGAFDPELAAACVRANNYTPLGDAFERELPALSRDADPRRISAAVDRAVYAHIQNVLRDKKQPVLSAYFSLKADAANALSRSRARALNWSDEKLAEMLVPGGGGHIKAAPTDFMSFERMLNHETFSILEKARFQSLDVVPIAYYLVRKQAEARSLRLLFRAKAVNMELAECELLPEGVA